MLRLVGLLLVGRVPSVTGEEVDVEDLGDVEEGGFGLVKVGRGPNLGNWGRRSEKPPELDGFFIVCLYFFLVFSPDNGLVAGWIARLELKMVGRIGPRGGGEGARGF